MTQQPEWERELLSMTFCDIGNDGNIYQRTDKLIPFVYSLLASERDRLVKSIGEAKFEMNIDEYLPLVKAWQGGFDVPFDHGFEAGKRAAQEVIKKGD